MFKSQKQKVKYEALKLELNKQETHVQDSIQCTVEYVHKGSVFKLIFTPVINSIIIK